MGQTAVPWESLRAAEPVRSGRGYRVSYPASVRALDGQTVRLDGFMIPIARVGGPQRFLLVPIPLAECLHCMPAGAGSVVEVVAARPVAVRTERVRLEGRLELSATGEYRGQTIYRLAEARTAR